MSEPEAERTLAEISSLQSKKQPNNLCVAAKWEGGKMAKWKKVKAYSLAWSFKENRGKVRLFFQEGNFDFSMESASELSAIADILRNEDESFVETDLKVIRTGMEIPGEEF